MTSNAVITSAIRTAIGDFGGALAAITPTDLATQVSSRAIAQAGIEATEIEMAVFGNVIHTEPKDMYLSRVAALNAGVPETAVALTLNRLCGSGLQAIVTGAEAIMLGNAKTVLAGGAESMSRAGHLLSAARFGVKMGDVTATDMLIGVLTDPFGHGHMGITAENVADRHAITREQQDTLALQSHQRAAKAIEAGYFKDQIVPINVRKGRKTAVFDTDEHVRPEITADDLSKLRPAFRKDGSVSAGNASGINDGAAALVLMSEEQAKRSGAPVLARLVAYGLGGVAPEVMGLGPIPAVRQAMAKAGLSIADMSVVESNEAFAAQACAVANVLEIPDAILNPNGGAIALGHPVGASGAIIMVKLVHELARTGGQYGLATMCIGGGQGIAVIVERL